MIRESAHEAYCAVRAKALCCNDEVEVVKVALCVPVAKDALFEANDFARGSEARKCRLAEPEFKRFGRGKYTALFKEGCLDFRSHAFVMNENRYYVN